MKIFELRDAAPLIAPDDIKHPSRWVRRRIEAGKFRAFQVGHRYYMDLPMIIDARRDVR